MKLFKGKKNKSNTSNEIKSNSVASSVYVHDYAKYDEEEPASLPTLSNSNSNSNSNTSISFNDNKNGNNINDMEILNTPNYEAAVQIFEKDTLQGIVTIIIYLIVGVIAYSFVFEDWHWIDSLYFSMITFTTVGYGDIAPETQWGRLFTSVYAVSGVFIIGSIIGLISERLAMVQLKAVKESIKKREEKAFEVLSSENEKQRLQRKKSFQEMVDEEPTVWMFFRKSTYQLSFIVLFLVGAWFEVKDQEGTTIDFVYYGKFNLISLHS